jgi:3-phenylpropionate/trans-cinnamate dioxygenase ferredoxin subunit
MNDWIDVIADSALAEGEHIVVDVDGVTAAVFRIDGAIYAIEDVCTHDGAEIASGRREGSEIVCPRNGARFCLKTGKVLRGPAYEDLPCLSVHMENGMVQIKDERWD